MIVSTRGRYALRVMIDIAEHPNEPYIPLKSIAARQGISEKYLESILKILVQEHLLEGMRGKGGGYRLTMSPSEYTIGRILRLTETSLEPVGSIRVEDSGIGIAKEDQKRIFERFYRVDKGRSKRVAGTGLGLSIVKHVTEFYGGCVSVESQSGVGSTFLVQLPAASLVQK